MKIALVGAEIEENLALRYIGASLKQAGHEVELYDFHERDQIDGVADGITASGPELVGLSMIFTARSREFVELAETIRGRGYAGHLTAGGHFASLHAQALLQDCSALDTVIHGDGEEPMVELAASLEHPEAVAGVTLRGDDEVRSTARRPNLDDLDARPWPMRPARLHQYLGHPIANLLSSRGCYASCAFCSIRAFQERNGGKRFRQRRVEAVADEMAALYHQRGVRIFNFQDDNFFVPSAAKNLERYRALSAALAEREVTRAAIQAKGRPDCIDDEVIELLRSMGLFRLFLGVETDAVAGLRTLGRGMDLEDNHRALALLRRKEIHTCFNLLLFDPDSTLESVGQNVDFMRDQAYFPLNFCRVEVYGGTPLEKRLLTEGRLIGDYRGYTYRITDDRAQRAYELFRELFWPRNFSLNGTHFGSMKLDYNFHLLRHFFPERAGGELEGRVKAVVHDINRHSAKLMGELLDFAASPRFDDGAAANRLLERLQIERQEVDEEIRGRIAVEMTQLEALAALDPGRRRFLQVAAASAATAALVASTPGCARNNTHMCEAPPPPPPPDDTHMCEAPPPPEPVQIISGQPLAQIQQQAQQILRQRIWPQRRAAFPQPDTIWVDLVFGPDATLQRASVHATHHPNLGPAIQQELIEQLPLEMITPQLGGAPQAEARFQLNWPAAQQQQSPPPPDDTHMCEAPPPSPPPDDTHMCEMAPEPMDPLNQKK